MMKLTVLVDNSSRIDNYLFAEPALSFLIQLEDKKILFDCGYSDIFVKNAFKMKFDVRNVTDIVLSHGHNDHAGGLIYLKKLYQDSLDLGLSVKTPTIVAHPDVFLPKIEKGMGNVGAPVDDVQLREIFNLNLKKAPNWITKDLCFLGEIPRTDGNENYIDDSSLVYNSSKGLVIITGCGHAGLVNIIEYAKQITKNNEIYALIGGFHLLKKTQEELKELSLYLKTQKIKQLYPCHCCDLRSKIYLAAEHNVNDVCVGDVFCF